MGRNLTTLNIKDTYEGLVQISGSILTDGTGSVIPSIEATASFATSASSASTSVSSSYALTASFAENVVPQDTGSLLTTASISDATVTFTKGDASTFNIVVNNVVNADSASYSATAVSSSYALTASFAENVVPQDTGSLLVTASSTDATITYTKGDGTTFTNVINNVSASISASYATAALSASYATDASTATSASYATNASTAVSSSYALTASYAANTSTPNLQEVTDIGATTTNSITTNGLISSGSVTISGSDVTLTNGSLVINNNIDESILKLTQTGTSVLDISNSAGFGVSIASNVNSPIAFTGGGINITSTKGLTSTKANITTSFTASGLIYPTADGTSGQVMTTNGSGVLSFTTPAGASFPFTGSADILGTLNVVASGSADAYTITSGSFSGSLLDNIGDTYTSTPSVKHVVSLTQAEYDAIVTPDTSTLYVISGSATTSPFPYSGSAVITGSLEISGSTDALVLTNYNALNFADDTAASSGGVPLGGVYRNGNFLQIRIV
jgi:hypothetical protein